MYALDALYSHVKDPKIDKLIDDFERVKTTADYIAGGQKIMDYVLENYYATGICTTPQLHLIGKKTPTWNMGKGAGSYRWEYAGK